jgi:cysteine-rich repeat protein
MTRQLLIRFGPFALTAFLFACATGGNGDSPADSDGGAPGIGGTPASSATGANSSLGGSPAQGGKSQGGAGQGGAGEGGKDAATTTTTTSTGAGGSSTSSTSTGAGAGGSAPLGWSCDPSYYGASDGCDCGCGVLDSDCVSAGAITCDYCQDAGSCGLGSCPGNINAIDNSTCDAVICGDGLVGPGEQCDDNNISVGDGCDALCQIEIPAAWVCSVSYYGGGDGCDCGCGAVDPDCSDNTAASCTYCQDSGSCGTGTCPANIQPNNNALCN